MAEPDHLKFTIENSESNIIQWDNSEDTVNPPVQIEYEEEKPIKYVVLRGKVEDTTGNLIYSERINGEYTGSVIIPVRPDGHFIFKKFLYSDEEYFKIIFVKSDGNIEEQHLSLSGSNLKNSPAWQIHLDLGTDMMFFEKTNLPLIKQVAITPSFGVKYHPPDTKIVYRAGLSFNAWPMSTNNTEAFQFLRIHVNISYPLTQLSTWSFSPYIGVASETMFSSNNQIVYSPAVFPDIGLLSYKNFAGGNIMHVNLSYLPRARVEYITLNSRELKVSLSWQHELNPRSYQVGLYFSDLVLLPDPFTEIHLQASGLKFTFNF